MKINKITADEVAEKLYIQKMYEKAMDVCTKTNTLLMRKIETGFITSLVL